MKSVGDSKNGNLVKLGEKGEKGGGGTKSNLALPKI